jgi:Leucine-rich repeat (LRR) protein
MTVDLIKASSSRFTPFLTFILELPGQGIREIAALDQCPNIRHLNLSRNSIGKIKGLEQCTSLVYLNLGYNQITQVEGLSACTLLKRLDLTGNRVASMGSLSHLQTLPVLLHVSFQTFGLLDPNPICGTASYRQEILALLPKLKSLDGHRRNAQVITSVSEVEAYDFNVAAFNVKLDPKPWVLDSDSTEARVNFADPEFTTSIAELKKMLQKGEKILQTLQ